MRREESLAQGVDSLLRGLNDEELLAVVLDRVLPLVDRADLGEDIDAGRKALLHERPGERGRIEIRANGGQDDAGLHGAAARTIRSAACSATSRAAARYWP